LISALKITTLSHDNLTKRVHKSNVTPPRLIYVEKPSQENEWSCICALRIRFCFFVLTVFLLDFWNG